LDGNLAWVSDPFPGSTHDITAIRATGALQARGTTWIARSCVGFLGWLAVFVGLEWSEGRVV